MNPAIGKKARKKVENHHLAMLSRDLLRCSGKTHQVGFSIYGASMPIACEIVGKQYSGSPKAFLKVHKDILRRWCQENWVPREPSLKKPRDNFKSGVDVKTDSFLQTYEWRRVRMVALKKYGAKCQCCGATPATGAVMNVDHIKPRKLFPHLALDVDNLQVLCHECNHGKGNWDMTDWRQEQYWQIDETDPDAKDHMKAIISGF